MFLFKKLLKLWSYFRDNRKKHFLLILGFTVISALVETISIGLVIPFIAILAEPNLLLNSSFAPYFKIFFDNNNLNILRFQFFVLFCIGIILSGLIRFLLTFLNTRFTFLIGSDICKDVYQRTLYQPYDRFLSINSSEFISGIFGKCSILIGGVINPVITIFSSLIIIIFISSAILILDPLVTILTATILILIYSIYLSFFKNKLSQNSLLISKKSNELVKTLNEGYGSIRELLLTNNQALYLNVFHQLDKDVKKSTANNIMIASSPRYFVEMLGIVTISSVALYFSSFDNNFVEKIPILTAITLGAQKLFPLINQLFNSITSIKGNALIIDDILGLLKLENIQFESSGQHQINFKNSISINSLDYHYPGNKKLILQNVNIKIKKGDRVGILGKTGSGKSTFQDLLMGLLDPTSGFIKIDDVALDANNKSAWQKNIASVPQSIFLIDASIKENIAFGIPKDQINIKLVYECLKKVDLLTFVKSLDYGVDTEIGENGSNLSGGQIQRIGIARSLYKKPNVIFFDEATSALDEETEENISHSISKLDSDITIFNISHRKKTFNNYNRILLISNKTITMIK